MHITIGCLATFHFWFPTLHVSTASDKRWGEKPWVREATQRTGSGRTAVQFILGRMYKYMDELNFDFWKY